MTSNSAAEPVTCPPKVWKRLMATSAARSTCKNREKDLVQTRKSLDGKLDELGAGNSHSHLQTSRDLVVTLRAIEYERNRSKELADLMEKTIEEGRQGRFDDSIDEAELEYKPASEADLFSHDEGEEEEGNKEGDPPASERPVGRPAKPTAAADGVTLKLHTFESTRIDSLGVADRAVAALKREGIETVADINVDLLKKRYGSGRLTAISGITPGDEQEIDKAVSKLEAEWKPPKPVMLPAPKRIQFPGHFKIINLSRPGSFVEASCGDLEALQARLSDFLNGADFVVVEPDQVLVKKKPILRIERIGEAQVAQAAAATSAPSKKRKAK